MDQAALDQGLGKHRLDGFFEPGQPIDTSDENIFTPRTCKSLSTLSQKLAPSAPSPTQ
jgi:hypothetical protein